MQKTEAVRNNTCWSGRPCNRISVPPQVSCSDSRCPHNVPRAFKQSDEAIFALSRIMSNIAGPRYTKRKLLTSVSSSIMLYGGQIYIPTYVAKIRSSYRRSALRVACSYRTVSYDAICVISSMIHIELLAQKQADLYVALHPEKNVERENTIAGARQLMGIGHTTDPCYRYMAEQKTCRTGLLHDTEDNHVWLLQGVFIPIWNSQRSLLSLLSERKRCTCCSLVRAWTILDVSCKLPLGSFQQ